MRNRSALEEIETSFLAPYAVHSGASQGRMHKETEHTYRTAFQRDRDRIIHTSAFRRLEYKTQVFVNHEGDYYRTRLTHTLEVAQIARTLARALGVHEELTEAICLAHDLGHTPFGHSGQDTMNKLMKEHGGFEHNKQSFRIVTFLENPYPDFAGLNLTYEVLEGITKHASEYDLPDGTLFIKAGYPTIEAQICNFADEIAYNNHDIDDGLKSGLLELADLNTVALWSSHHSVKALINTLVTDLILNTDKQIEERGIKTLDDVRLQGRGLVDFSPEIKEKNAELKRTLFSKLYRHYRVERMADKAERILTELFNAYTKNPKILPPSFLSTYESKTPIQRIVCDYIAGMTDRFALDEYSKLFDPHAKV
jgi:dGTPase